VIHRTWWLTRRLKSTLGPFFNVFYRAILRVIVHYYGPELRIAITQDALRAYNRLLPIPPVQNHDKDLGGRCRRVARLRNAHVAHE